jgi:hypothetical protein
MIDDTADAIILRWPKIVEQPKAAPRHRLDWLAFIVWVIRLCAECLGWTAIVGLITMF